MKLAAYIATALFNEGNAAIVRIIDVLEIKIEPQCKQYADLYNTERIKRQERASLSSIKEACAACRMNQIQEQQFFKESESESECFLYGTRIAD